MTYPSISRWVVVTGVAMRICAVLYGHEYLRSRMELVAHHNSFLQAEEGLFILENQMDPYSQGDYHQPPLTLILLYYCKHVFGPVYFRTCTAVLLIAADLLGVFLLASFLPISSTSSSNKNDLPDSTKKQIELLEAAPADDPSFNHVSKEKMISNLLQSRQSILSALAEFYLLNPISVATVGALCSSPICHTAFILALKFSLFTSDKIECQHLSALFMAVAAHLSPVYGLLAVPLAALPGREWLYLRSGNWRWRIGKMLKFLLRFSVYTLLLFLVSAVWLDHSWTFVTEFYLWTFSMRGSLEPNIGFWWYVFQEVFSRFRTFYLVCWASQPLIFVLPITLALRIRPLAACAVTLFLTMLAQPHPTVGDIAFAYSLFLIFPGTLAGIQYLNFLKLMAIFPLCLIPVMWYLWLQPTSGNANFIYFQTIVFQLACIRIICGFTRCEYDFQRALLTGNHKKQHGRQK